MIARYAMLECGKNYKGTMSLMCSDCCSIDDEEHRLNNCPKYGNINYVNDDCAIRFDTIFSDKIDDLKLIIPRIANVWNVKSGQGSMSTLS